MLILPRRGSWFLLGEILTDAELEPDPPVAESACGTCVRCAPACPTDAFPAPFVLDARRCISYWTIEHRGPIPRAMRASIGTWIFGCDVCQDVCPFNRFAEETKWPEFRPEAGCGPRLDVLEVLALADDTTFRARFGTSAIRYAGRGSLVRNAAIVATNLGTVSATPLLARRAREDADPIVRGHALAALAALDRAAGRAAAVRALASDGDAFVRAEAEAALE
jgi:epoxyqueuosine reductase